MYVFTNKSNDASDDEKSNGPHPSRGWYLQKLGSYLGIKHICAFHHICPIELFCYLNFIPSQISIVMPWSPCDVISEVEWHSELFMYSRPRASDIWLYFSREIRFTNYTWCHSDVSNGSGKWRSLLLIYRSHGKAYRKGGEEHARSFTRIFFELSSVASTSQTPNSIDRRSRAGRSKHTPNRRWRHLKLVITNDV